MLYAIAFLVELAAWAAVSALPFLVLDGWPAWVAAVLLFAVIVTGWGLVMAPRARWPLPAPAYYAIKAVLYLVAALVIWRWNTGAGIAFLAAVIVSEPALAMRSREEFAGGTGG